MIVLSLLQQLADDGYGTVNQDLQVGTLPLTGDGKARNGMAITARGMPVDRLNVNIQGIDFYVRNSNPLVALTAAQNLQEYLKEAFGRLCDLPACPPYTTATYSNVMITPVSSITDMGRDDNGGTTFMVSGEIQYKKDETN